MDLVKAGFYLLITAVCVTVSAVTTYAGLLHYMGWPAAVLLALVVGSGLFICDREVMIGLTGHNRSMTRPLTGLAVFMALSWSAMFTYFYTNRHAETVARSHYDAVAKIHGDNLGKALVAAQNANVLAKTSELIELELKNFSREVNDPTNEGIGPNARAKAKQIYGMMPRRIQELSLPVRRYTDEEKRQVIATLRNNVLSALADARKTDEATALEGRIAELLERYRKTIAEVEDRGISLAGYERWSSTDYLAITQRWRNETNDLSRYVERIERIGIERAPKVTLSELPPVSGGQLGSFEDVFRHAFQEMPYPWATATAVGISFIVDLIPLILAYALFWGGEKNIVHKPAVGLPLVTRRVTEG